MCADSDSRTQPSRKLESITGSLLPRLQRIGKESIPVPITQRWNWLQSTVDFGQIYKAPIWSALVLLRAYLKQVQTLCPPGPGISLPHIFSGEVLVRGTDGPGSVSWRGCRKTRVHGLVFFSNCCCYDIPSSFVLAFWWRQIGKGLHPVHSGKRSPDSWGVVNWSQGNERTARVRRKGGGAPQGAHTWHFTSSSSPISFFHCSLSTQVC